MIDTIRILVVGCGNMGASHARAYHKLDGFEIVGCVSRGPATRGKLSAELGGIPEFDNFYTALNKTKPEAVSINTFPDTHAEFALKAIESGAHVFAEKPIALTVEQAESVKNASLSSGKKVVVGYILRHHLAWMTFVEKAQTLGKPLVMRMNLNQQSSGEDWEWQKRLMDSFPPYCGLWCTLC